MSARLRDRLVLPFVPTFARLFPGLPLRMRRSSSRIPVAGLLLALVLLLAGLPCDGPFALSGQVATAAAQEVTAAGQAAETPVTETEAKPTPETAPAPGPADEAAVDNAAADDKAAGDDQAKLQFAFREQKWVDVLDWFARQADLSLVVNELPPGTFTYSDTRSYTPSEALDLLNGVLVTRGFSLVRRERVLVCANLKEGIPDGLVPRVTIEELDGRGQFELVELMFPLGRRPGPAVLSEITPLVGSLGRATLLPETRQMLVSTTAGKMRAIRAIIESIPEPPIPAPKPPAPPAPVPVLEMYPAKGFDVEAAMDMLKVVAADAKITLDKQNNQLQVFATPERQAAVKTFIEKISSDTPASSRPVLNVYSIQHPAPASLAEQLKMVVAGATVSVDADPSRLVVLATPAEHERIAEAIETLQAEGTEGIQQAPAVYSLEAADPTVVMGMVQALYPKAKVTVDTANRRVIVVASAAQQLVVRGLVEQLEERREDPLRIQEYALEKLDPAQTQALLATLVPGLRVTVDAENRRLRVIGSVEEQSRVEALLEQLAQAAPAQAARVIRRHDLSTTLRDRFQRMYLQLDPRLQSLQLLDSGKPGELVVLATEEQHGRVERVLEQLKAQFTEEDRQLRYYEASPTIRERFLALRGQLAPQLGQIQILQDASDPRLGVVATDEEHQQVAALVEQLQKDQPDERAQLHVFPVTPTQRTRFQALLPTLKDELGSVRVLDESRPRELVVWATPTQREYIEGLLPTLQADDQQPDMQLVAYPVNEGDPAAVQKVLAELYPDTKILVDTESRRVMVWTTAEQHEAIAEAVEQLDAPAAAGKKRMAYYRLGELDVREVVALFQRLVPEMSIVAEARNNSIIAWGDEKQHAKLSKTVEEFRAQEGATARKVASYDCGTLGVEKVRVMLADLAPTARLVGDPAKRTVLAWATPQDHQAIEQAVAIMVQSEGQGDASLSIYPVSRVTPAEMVPLLKEILPSAQVQAAVDGKRLLVWATADQHRQVEKVIGQVEAGDPRQQDAGPRTYRSRPEVLQKVKGLMLEKTPQARILSEDRPGLVLIWASTAEHAEIQRLFETLEKEVPPNDRQYQTYELRKASAAQARDLINSVVPGVQYLSSDSPQRLLLRASEADHEVVKKTLEELEAALAEPVPQLVRVFDLKEASPTLIQSLLDPKLLEGLSVTPDAQRNALLVRGGEEPLQRLGTAITALLEQLPEPKRREPHAYRLRHADPTTVLTPLQAVFPSVTMTVDAATRSILTTALPEEHARLAEAVAQLDQPTVTQRVTRTYRLRGSNLSSTRDAIQSLVPKALLSADWASRMLLVTGTAEEQAQVAEVVEQLSRPMEADRQTKVYTLKVADAGAVEQAIESMLPMVRAVSDDDTRTVLVTASTDEQARIADLVAQLDQLTPSNRQTQVYRLRQASVRAAQSALEEQFPRATFAADRTLRTLLATATAEEHAQIADVIRQLDQPATSDRQTQVYRLKHGNVGSAEDALLEQFPEASVAADRGNRSLLVTATPEVQARIAEVVKQFDQPAESNRDAKVYRLERADVRSAQEALEDQFPEATIAADPDNRSLLATATAEEHERIAAIVQQLDVPSESTQETRAYQFRAGDVRAARDAVEALLPRATVSVDVRNRTLVVTAAADEQLRVAELVPQLDREAAQLPTLVAYKINNVSVASVLDSLQDLYSDNDDVSISADVANGAILAKALPRDQAEISQVVARLENGVTDDTRRRLEAYPLPASDSKAVLETLSQLFRGKSPTVDISINQQTSQVLAVATPDQHRVLAEAVKQIRGEPTVFEVFALRSVDPFTIQGAIDRLYEGQPQRPWANADGEAQQLFVRGTVEQMKQVRDLLKKMGELPDESQQGMRVIRYRGDVGEALKQLEQAWPGLRANKIRILRQEAPEQESPPQDGNGNGATLDAPPATPPAAGDRAGDALLNRLGDLRYVADRDAGDAAGGQEAPPVLILPSDDSITVVSDDPEALAQVEALLRTIEQQSTMASGAGNFSVIPLRNAGARAVAKILEELFKQMPITQRATLGRVSMVADDRLNAVVVHGRPGDRAVIAELLRVLDSSNIPDSLANTRPQIVPLDYMNATEARSILRGVYRTQLESGGRRQEMEIPKGVSSEVALLLRQMNASNSGPLLTLEVDEVTNSLVIMAPRQLVDEVAALAKRLDENAQQSDRRTVGVVPLQGTNVREIQGALQGLMRTRRSSR